MTNIPQFRENAVTAVQRTAERIIIWVRDTERKDGETVTTKVFEPIELPFNTCSEAVKNEAMGYGLEVRLTRAAALSKDTKSGKSATGLEKYEAIKKLADHYASGTDAWAMSGAGGGLSSETRVLIEALSRALDCDLDAAEAHVREMSSAERDALRIDAEIKPHIDAIYAERAKSQGTDTKGLLAKLRAKA